MKRILVCMLVFLLAGFAFAGCKDDNTGDDNTGDNTTNDTGNVPPVNGNDSGNGSGLSVISCDISSMDLCIEAEDTQDACTTEGGTVVSECPAGESKSCDLSGATVYLYGDTYDVMTCDDLEVAMNSSLK